MHLVAKALEDTATKCSLIASIYCGLLVASKDNNCRVFLLEANLIKSENLRMLGATLYKTAPPSLLRGKKTKDSEQEILPQNSTTARSEVLEVSLPVTL